MSASPILLGLPVELQIQIAKVLDDDGLRTIRLTCSELLVNTMDVFADRFFGFRKHLYTTRGLTALLEISKIPRLARRMHSVELVVVGVKHERIEARPVSVADLVERDSKKLWYEKECRSNLKDLAAGRQLRLTTDLWVGEASDELERLEHGSENCARYKRPTGVYGTSNFLTNIFPWATPPNIRGEHISPAAQDVNTALIRTEHVLEFLDFGYRSLELFRERSNLWKLSGSQLSSLSVSWSGLRILKLAFGDPTPPASLSTLLHAATGLTAVCIESRYPVYLQIFNQHLRRNQLTHIIISCMNCEYVELVRFVARQAQSLLHLGLYDVMLGTALEPDTWQSWRLFFAVASKRLHLKCLELSELHSWSLRFGQSFEGEYFLPDGRGCDLAVEDDESGLKDVMLAIAAGGVFYENAKIEEIVDESPDEESEDEETVDEFPNEESEGEEGSDAGESGEEDSSEGGDESESDDEEDERFAKQLVEGLKEWMFYE